MLLTDIVVVGIGATLLTSGAAKLPRVAEFGAVIRRLLPQPLAAHAGLVLGFSAVAVAIEIGLGALLIIAPTWRPGQIGAAGVCTMILLAAVHGYLRYAGMECLCFGSLASGGGFGKRSVARAAVLAVAGLAVALFGDGGGGGVGAESVATICLLATGVLVSGAAVAQAAAALGSVGRTGRAVVMR